MPTPPGNNGNAAPRAALTKWLWTAILAGLAVWLLAILLVSDGKEKGKASAPGAAAVRAPAGEPFKGAAVFNKRRDVRSSRPSPVTTLRVDQAQSK